MKILIDLDDRHTIDGLEYIRASILAGEADEVRVTEEHKRSVTLVRKRDGIPAVGGRQEARRVAALVKERNLAYEDRKTARIAEHALKESGAPAPPRKQGVWPEERIAKLIELMKAGHAYVTIAEKLGTTQGAIAGEVSILKRSGRLPAIRHNHPQSGNAK